MQIAEGKDAVLHFLENEALRRTNEKPGVWSLRRDDGGTLVLFIEGWSFVGSGNISIGGNLIQIADGKVVAATKPS